MGKVYTRFLSCVADPKSEGGGGGKKSPLSPIPLPFSIPPYPVSTPATQANRFQTKTAQKPYPMGRHIPKGLPPPPPFIISLRSLVSKVFAEGR